MRETEESILIACDTEVMEGENLRIPGVLKLKRHRTVSLSWGIAGNRAIGDDFSHWLSIYDWPPSDWPSFSEDVAGHLSELNGKQRERTKRAGLEPTESEIACCLLVGWLDEPQIYEFDERGRITPYWGKGFHAIGQGKVPAYVAHRTLVNHVDPGLEKVKQLRICAKGLDRQRGSPDRPTSNPTTDTIP